MPRLSDMKRAAKAYGVDLVTGGKHWKFTKAGCRTYPVPAHNGLKEEISDTYVRGFCRCFGITDVDKFRSLL